MLYAVDEWLRFRAGQRKRAFLLKALLGVVWFYIAYAFRFVINLLIEPQINPIKHFPVVTVSHKLILPQGLPGAALPMALQQVGLSAVRANTVAGLIVTGIPGIFGFLAWELKENWKLYRANRPRSLKAVHFGSHGESIAQLLRPGLHSGTLPKTFARLRKAHRQADALAGADEGAAQYADSVIHKQLEAIAHVREAVEHFLQRAWINLVNQHPAFAESPIRLEEVSVGATQIVVALSCPVREDEPLRIAYEQRAGWIVARIGEWGWAAALEADRASLLRAALDGLYTLSAVDIVHDHVETSLGAGRLRLAFTAKEMIVRPADRPTVEAVYDLGAKRMSPKFMSADTDDRLRTVRSEELLFWQTPLPWDRWVNLWETARPAGTVVEQVRDTQSDRVPAPVGAI
jgi:hypothetical protein